MVMALEQLDPKLSRSVHISGVQGLYLDSFERIINCPVPIDEKSVIELTAIVKSIKTQHNNVADNMALGVGEFKLLNPTHNSIFYSSSYDPTNAFLDKFYKSRISIRTLIEHHVSLEENGTGIINDECSVHSVLSEAINECSYIITTYKGSNINVKLECDEHLSFTYIPSHLYYAFFEILKNAAKATVDKYGDDSEDYPINVKVSEGVEDIIIKISDRGDSFPISQLKNVESYLYSTADPPVENDDRPIIAGFGYGISMAGLYCEIFGGSLKISPFEKIGTDATIYIHKSGLINEFLD